MVKSSIPILEVMQLAESKRKSPFATEQAQIQNAATQSQLSNQLFENSLKTPKVEQANIEMANSLRKDLGEKPRGWAAVAAGALEGYAHGQKRKSILDDQERLKKYNATLEKLQDVVVESGTRLAKFQKQEQIKQGLSPYVSRTLDLILEKAPQERIDLAGMDLARRYNEATGEDWQYEMGSGKGIAVVNPKTGESAILPWSALTPPELQEKVLMADPIYQSQFMRQQQMENREFQREEQKLVLQERDVAANELKAGKEANEKKVAEEQQTQAYNNAYEMLKDGANPTLHPGRLESVANFVTGKKPSETPTTADQQKYAQYINEINALEAKKTGLKGVNPLDANLSPAEAMKLIEGKIGKGNATSSSKNQLVKTETQGELQAIDQEIEKINAELEK